VAALRQYPLLNASLDGANIVYHTKFTGLAWHWRGGLIVPGSRAAGEKNVLCLQRAIVVPGRARPLAPA